MSPSRTVAVSDSGKGVETQEGMSLLGVSLNKLVKPTCDPVNSVRGPQNGMVKDLSGKRVLAFLGC